GLMPDVLEHPPPATVPAAPAARAMPAIVLTVVFEFPFQPHRGWIPLRQVMSVRPHIWRRDACDSPGR
ncbi:MAG TPA: hypothetical protein VNV65_09705, partial [Candidatus Solibacter sp.]|nr:hypothetical protein [Candidatus Solibacter sp.]